VGDLVTRTEVGTLGQVHVEHVVLMKSDLQPGGAVYTPLAVIPLARTPGP
jgi:2'-5' RNA ligase